MKAHLPISNNQVSLITIAMGIMALSTLRHANAEDCDQNAGVPTPPPLAEQVDRILKGRPFASIYLSVSALKGALPEETKAAVASALSSAGLKLDSYTDYDSLGEVDLVPSAKSEARPALVQMFSDLDWEGARERISKLPFVKNVQKLTSRCIPVTTVWEDPRTLLVPECYGGQSKTRHSLYVTFQNTRVYSEQRDQVIALAGDEFRARSTPRVEHAGSIYVTATGSQEELTASIAQLRERLGDAVLSAEVRFTVVSPVQESGRPVDLRRNLPEGFAR